MAIASLFRNGRNQAVRLPKGLEFKDISEVEVRREGNSIILSPVRKSWQSFSEEVEADDDFLVEREDVIQADRVEF